MKPFRRPITRLSQPTQAAGGPYTYEYLFAEGSANGAPSGTPVRITPIQHWDSKWAWYAVRHRRLAGQTPSFVIAKADHYNIAAGERLACWATSPDNDTWNDFDNFTIGAVDLEFSNSSAFTSNKIYIAHWPMYPWSRVQRKLAEWTADSRAAETASTTNYIISNATARSADDGSGRTAPALPFYGFKLTNPSGYTKNKAILATFNHPSETTGAFAFEGAIDWLLAGSDEAEFLLDWFEFYCYPCLNPQGLYTGYFRSCPQNKTLDHNRQWATAGTLECIDAFKTAMNADTGGTIQVGLDFHSEASADTIFGNAEDHTETIHAAFNTEMAALDAAFDLRTSNIPTSLRYWWLNTLSAQLAASLEQGGTTARNVSDYLAFGENVMKALAYMLADGRWDNGPGVGSRDFNGTSDRIDWSSVFDPTGGPLTISLWVYLDSVAVNQYIFHIGLADNSAGIQFGIANATGAFSFTRKGSTNLWRYSAGSVLSTGAWVHLLATSTGTFNDYTTMHLYKDGAEVTYGGGQNGATESTASGSWSLGGRILDDLRNTNGKIAQVGVWNRVLSSAEIADLAAGQAPDLAAASGLQFYFKGNTSSLVASPGGTGTADGTTQLTGVGNGPSIVY